MSLLLPAIIKCLILRKRGDLVSPSLTHDRLLKSSILLRYYTVSYSCCKLKSVTTTSCLEDSAPQHSTPSFSSYVLSTRYSPASPEGDEMNVPFMVEHPAVTFSTLASYGAAHCKKKKKMFLNGAQATLIC